MARLHVLAVAGALLLAGCSQGSDPPATASPEVETVTVSATPSPEPEPEPEPIQLATIRGPFNGTCILVKSVGPIDSIPRQPAQWKFRPQGDRKVTLFSKSGGYTMKLNRTSPTKFYGSTIQGNGWQFAYAVKIVRTDEDGFATKLEVVSHDTAPGGIGRENFLCQMKAGAAGPGSGD